MVFRWALWEGHSTPTGWKRLPESHCAILLWVFYYGYIMRSWFPTSRITGQTINWIMPEHHYQSTVVLVRYEDLSFLFTFSLFIGRSGGIPRYTSGAQRTARRSWFSASNIRVQENNTGREIWQQVPLPSEPSSCPQVSLLTWVFSVYESN